MAVGFSACESEEPASGLGQVNAPDGGTTATTTTVDPDENAATDKDIKVVETSGYAPTVMQALSNISATTTSE